MMNVALAGRTVMDMVGIGGTALLPLPGIATRGRVWLKAEYTNPFGSVKDRTAAYLLAWAREEGGPDVSVVDSTSGNLGVALAHLGPRFGVHVTLVMDGSLPIERIEGVRRAGASVRVVHECHDGLTFRESRIAVARELGRQPGWLWLNQYGNEAGVRAHEETTGPEVWADLNGEVDVVVASVGSGGTLCGIGAALRGRSRSLLIVGVEPVGSTISGGADGEYLPSGSGMRGMPETVARHRSLIDFFAKTPDRVAAAWAVHLMQRYGLEVGLTTGAAVAVAVMLAEEWNAQIALIAPDRGHSFRPAIDRLAQNVSTSGSASLIDMRRFGRNVHRTADRRDLSPTPGGTKTGGPRGATP
jgi:cysteine synthase A